MMFQKGEGFFFTVIWLRLFFLGGGVEMSPPKKKKWKGIWSHHGFPANFPTPLAPSCWEASFSYSLVTATGQTSLPL